MIDKMLETAIEIEGLVRILKDGEPSDEVYILLRRKIADLAAFIASGKPTDDKNSGEIPQSAIEQEKEDDLRMEYAENEELKIWETITKQENPDDDIFLTLDEGPAEKPKNEETAGNPQDKTAGGKPKPGGNLRGRFSINDRFLFARELFNNSMKEFDSTLKSLEGVDDYRVIEDYFYNELDWDRENPMVKEFMEKIK